MPENVEFHLAGGQNPLILVPAYVDGKGPYQFILDTGASQCVLSTALAADLGMTPEAAEQAMGAGGPVNCSLGRVSSLAIGSIQERDLQVVVTSEMERIGAAIGAKVDGAVGFNFLNGYRITVDYQRRLLCLAGASEVNGKHGHAAGPIPFQLAAPSKPLILAPVFVNGQGPFQFALDTGASKTMVAPGLVRELAIETAEAGYATGGGGQIKISTGRISSLTVGDACVRDHFVAAGEFLNGLSTAIGVKLDGIIGYNFLSQFQVTIDYPEGVLEFSACTPVGASARAEPPVPDTATSNITQSAFDQDFAANRE